MDKLLEKISSYHFLNTLIPGACIAYLSNHFFGIDFLTEELLYNILGQNSSFVTELKPSKNHGIASSTK